MEVPKFDVAVRKGGGEHLANRQAGFRSTLQLSVSTRVGVLLIQHAAERLPVAAVPRLEILACNISRAGHGGTPLLRDLIDAEIIPRRHWKTPGAKLRWRSRARDQRRSDRPVIG